MMPLRVDFRDVVASMVGRWQQYLAAIGIDQGALRNKHGPCPACGGKDRFRFDDQDGRGTFFCNGCGPGDGVELASRFAGRRRSDTLLDAAQWLGMGDVATPARRVAVAAPKQVDLDDYQRKRETARRILSESTTDHPLLSRYLRSRGLSGDNIPGDLRLHPGCRYFDGGEIAGIYPVMVAVIRNVAGQVVGLHRTYLATDGHVKADVPSPKKMLSLWPGSLRGGSVMLARAADGLILCEGVETGLALLQSTGRPVWCALSAGGLERVEVPHGIGGLVVAGDNDSHRTGQGEKSARIAATRLGALTMIPGVPGDWLDELNRKNNQ